MIGSQINFSRVIHTDFRDLLIKNGYPSHFITDVANHKSRTNVVTCESTPKIFFFLFPMGQSSSLIEKKLRYPNQYSPRLVFFSKLKNLLPLLKNTNVVYKIACSDCSPSYIGETLRNLSRRVTRHKSDEKKHIKGNERLVDCTALAPTC